jgi:hypothetical protein
MRLRPDGDGMEVELLVSSIILREWGGKAYLNNGEALLKVVSIGMIFSEVYSLEALRERELSVTAFANWVGKKLLRAMLVSNVCDSCLLITDKTILVFS